MTHQSNLPLKKRPLRQTNLSKDELNPTSIFVNGPSHLSSEVNKNSDSKKIEGHFTSLLQAVENELEQIPSTGTKHESNAILYQPHARMDGLSHMKSGGTIMKQPQSQYLESPMTKKEYNFDLLWWHRYNELVLFKNLHGHCNVKQRYLPNKALGKWVHKQRHELNKVRMNEPSILNEHRVRALEMIGFQYNISKRADGLWHKRFLELLDFKEKFGSCKVPQNYSTNSALGRWVHRQRHELKRKRNGMPSLMTSYRMELLRRVGL